VRAGAVFVGTACLCASVSGAVPAYQLVGQYDLPTAGPFDVLPDGRVMMLDGTDVVVQDALNASSFSTVGSIPAGLVPTTPSFFSVSPDGSRIGIGDNVFGAGAQVLLLESSALSTGGASPVSTVASPNFEAHWADNDTLYVTGSDGGSVVNEIDAPTASARTVIDGVGGASGGVTTDGTYLYTANGFAGSGPSGTGEVKAFTLADVAGAATPIDFEANGVSVVDDLSGNSLGFDSEGNFLIGGGDYFGASGDFGYFAVYDDAALAGALAGGGIMPRSERLTFTPRLSTDSYSAQLNETTGELLVTYFDNTTFTPGTTVYRYQVPTPGAAGALALLGAAGLRRRRRA